MVKNLTEIMNNLLATITASREVVVGYAKSLVFIMLTIDLVLTTMSDVLDENVNWIKRLMMQAMKFGAWIWFIDNIITGLNFAESMQQSFVTIGNTVGGSNVNVNDPSAIVNQGLEQLNAVTDQVFAKITNLSLILTNLLTIILCLVAAACYAMLGAGIVLNTLLWNLFLMLMVPLLGFGAWNRTSFLAQNAITAICSLSARFMVFTAVMGLTLGVVATMPPPEAEWQKLFEHCIKLATMVMFTIIAPGMAANFFNGSPTLSVNRAFQNMGGVGAAGISGGARGAADGGAKGARIVGAVAGPAGSVIGGIAGAATGAIVAAGSAGLKETAKRVKS